MLSQTIFSCQCASGLTYEERLDIARRKLGICPALGLTGRLFINGDSCVAVMEGEASILEKYCTALIADERMALYVPHAQYEIEQHEFEDYIIWLDIAPVPSEHTAIRKLTRDSLNTAIPDNISSRVRILIQSCIFPEDA